MSGSSWVRGFIAALAAYAASDLGWSIAAGNVLASHRQAPLWLILPAVWIAGPVALWLSERRRSNEG